uniref:C2 domain-containing protein n=1 Tax=Ciona savignyi TaxID=51511 RepID=H2YGM4_CIOSA
MRGQLKLVICGTARKLTVTFLGVRSLPQSCTRVRSHPSYLYLKISLFPDNENRVRHKTTPRTLTSDSLSVHESFSFNISRRDISKRILISAWSKSDVFDRSSFIGCMSFGVKRIVANQEVIQGWYYFLSETLGRKKHLTGKVINESEYSDYECHDRGQLRVQTLPRKVISEPQNTRNETTIQKNFPTNNARCSRMPIRNKRSCDIESNPTKRMRLAEDVHTTVRNNELGETE